MMVRRLLLVLAPVIIGAAGVFFLIQKKSELPSAETTLRVSDIKSSSTAREVPPPFVPPPSAQQQVLKNKLDNLISDHKVSPQQHQTLTNYAALRQKVFLKPEEKEARAKLLMDHEFLAGLGPVLKLAATKESPDLAKLQNAAIDLLLEAQQTYHSSDAAEVLSSIVQDNQIENTELSTGERKALAGVKAEVLYRWSSQDPSLAEKIPNLLPGPVSLQIWNNVLSTQKNNLAESLAEVHPDQ